MRQELLPGAADLPPKAMSSAQIDDQMPEPPVAQESLNGHDPAVASAASHPPAIELILPTRPGYEKVARSTAASVAEYMGFSAERIEDLKTSVAEVCMNAIEHGNALDAALAVRVTLRLLDDRLEVAVQDHGKKALPDPLPEPGVPDPSRGWGLFFITRLMDEVQFARLLDGANYVNMVLYLEPAPALLSEQPAAPEAVVQTAPQDQAELGVDNVPADGVSLGQAESGSVALTEAIAAAGDPATAPAGTGTVSHDHPPDPEHDQES